MIKRSTLLSELFGDPIGSYAGDAPVGVRDERDTEICEDCGMFVIDGECNCTKGKAGTSTSSWGVEVEACKRCGMLPLRETQDGSCPTCDEEGCTHEMDEGGVDEVAPPGHEKMVRGLKKAKGVDNPFAVSWAHHNKYHKK